MTTIDLTQQERTIIRRICQRKIKNHRDPLYDEPVLTGLMLTKDWELLEKKLHDLDINDRDKRRKTDPIPPTF